VHAMYVCSRRPEERDFLRSMFAAASRSARFFSRFSQDESARWCTPFHHRVGHRLGAATGFYGVNGPITTLKKIITMKK
jgi:hypothetical protein